MQTPHIRVLLIEDDPADAESTQRALAKTADARFETCWVRELSQAFERLHRDTFDVVLLDLGLPQYSGLESLHEVRSKHGEIPIVVLTGLSNGGAALEALETGAQDYLVKGELSVQSLSRLIQFAIQRQQLLAATIESKLAAEARAKLAAIVEFSDDAIVGESLDGIVLSWNQGAQRMYGYSADEMLGRSAPFLIPPDHADEFQRIVAAVRRGEPLRNFDTERIRKDGRRVQISLSVSPYKDAEGNVIGVAQIARDVSEYKRAERALDERIQLATLTADVGIILTRQGSLQTVLQGCAEAVTKHLDAAFARIWTLDADENVLQLQASAGMYTHLNGSHGRVPVGQLKIGRIAEQRKPHLTNSVIGDPQVGDQEWAKREGMVAFAGYPLVCQDRLVGVVALFSRTKLSEATLKALESVADGIAMGIEACRVADELRASEERFELAVRGSNDGLFDWNLLTDEMYLSPRINEMLGYAHDELEQLRSTLESRLHPDEHDAIMAQIQRAVEEHTQFVCEHRMRTKSGEYRWFFSRGQALWDDNGRAYRMAGSVTDVSERKRMETVLAERDKQLRQSQKLEAVGALAGGIAHEFNNLLQAILGFTRLAMESLPADGQTCQDLQQVSKAAGRASTLTRQLLGFTAATNGSSETPSRRARSSRTC